MRAAPIIDVSLNRAARSGQSEILVEMKITIREFRIIERSRPQLHLHEHIPPLNEHHLDEQQRPIRQFLGRHLEEFLDLRYMARMGMRYFLQKRLVEKCLSHA